MEGSSDTLLTWTPANWITVTLMVALSFTILGAVARVIQQRRAAQASS